MPNKKRTCAYKGEKSLASVQRSQPEIETEEMGESNFYFNLTQTTKNWKMVQMRFKDRIIDLCSCYRCLSALYHTHERGPEAGILATPLQSAHASSQGGLQSAWVQFCWLGGTFVSNGFTLEPHQKYFICFFFTLRQGKVLYIFIYTWKASNF